MKQSFTFFLAFLVAFCAKAQDAELLTSYSNNDIQNILNALSVPDGVVNAQYEVDFYKINYRTIHPNGDSVDVTGAICVPKNVDCPLPLASYQHGTVASKTNVPSYENGESQIGVLYASGGYVVAMPDYIGLGDSPGIHLYVHAESQADAAIDLLRTAQNLDDELGFSWNEQLFVFGYSQGGHATAALHQKIEAELSDEFTVTASAPMSGPYDISGVQAEVLTNDEAYPTPGYLPYVVLSYNEVYGTLYDELTDVFKPEYAEIIPDLFDGTNSMGFINNQFPDIPNEMLLPEVFEAFENDPEHPIRVALEDNDVYDWAPQAPTRLYYCNQDDQVGFMNSVVAEEAMNNNGAPDVQAVDGGPFDHGGCAPLALISGYLFFENYRDAFEPEVDVLVVDASGAEAPDGSVSVTVPDAENDWLYTWSNGTEGLELTDVTPGSYELTISDPDGCGFTVAVEVGNATNIAEQKWKKLKVWPQPASTTMQFNIQGAKSLELYDMTGRKVTRFNIEGLQSVDISNLPAGRYVAVFDGVKRLPVMVR